ncbi:helix-turn-helix domain-containing protein [Methylobacterium gossipiicola]|uniref:AraC-type DNA-binding protein n=1 Tax=Methylobacterium gossipiicola TaxID=582675 RepID=A0A1I2X6L6_9HYPH|nr:AraC family transcriptional regulator [Methylobacterium gossipiicola]SFH09042.1 AraC-type DNA-binding protein [Methylobacterium gossipiicola]
MRREYRDCGCDIAFEGEIETVLCDSTGKGWPGIGFTDMILGPRGRVSIAEHGLHFALSLRPGKQTFLYADRAHRFGEDNIAVLHPGASVTATWTRGFRTLALKLAPEAVERIAGLPPDRTGIRTQFVRARPQAAVEYLLRTVSADLESGCPHGALLVESVAATLVRLFSTPEPTSRAQPRLRTADAARLRDLIASRMAEPLGLAELAAAAGMSVGHFVRAFKASFGTTPYQYILRARVLRAQELIETGDAGLAEVARQVGFTDLSQMSKTFRRILDRTPSAIARAVKQCR